jgi:hypothetical protein
MGAQEFICLGFDRIALTDQAAGLCQDQAEHGDRRSIQRHRKSG